jgi:hypothetical protein
MLAFPLSTMPGMPWGAQDVMTVPTSVVGALAGLHATPPQHVGVTLFSGAWVLTVGALIALCFTHGYKECHANLWPIKVSGRTWLGGSRSNGQ